MKITREELQAIENHMSNIPAVAGMYTPVLIAWCRALLDEHDNAYRRGAEHMREACLGVVERFMDFGSPHPGMIAHKISALPTPEEGM